jgi:hypothetical protein
MESKLLEIRKDSLERKYKVNSLFRSLRWRLLEYKLKESKSESDKYLIYKKLWDELCYSNQS